MLRLLNSRRAMRLVQRPYRTGDFVLRVRGAYRAVGACLVVVAGVMTAAAQGVNTLRDSLGWAVYDRSPVTVRFHRTDTRVETSGGGRREQLLLRDAVEVKYDGRVSEKVTPLSSTSGQETTGHEVVYLNGRWRRIGGDDDRVTITGGRPPLNPLLILMAGEQLQTGSRMISRSRSQLVQLLDLISDEEKAQVSQRATPEGLRTELFDWKRGDNASMVVTTLPEKGGAISRWEATDGRGRVTCRFEASDHVPVSLGTGMLRWIPRRTVREDYHYLPNGEVVVYRTELSDIVVEPKQGPFTDAELLGNVLATGQIRDARLGIRVDLWEAISPAAVIDDTPAGHGVASSSTVSVVEPQPATAFSSVPPIVADGETRPAGVSGWRWLGAIGLLSASICVVMVCSIVIWWQGRLHDGTY